MDDDAPDILHKPDVVIPSLCTTFTGDYAPAVHHIETENAQHFVPYQDSPLASTARFNHLIDDGGCSTEAQQCWVLSQGKLSAALKQHQKKDIYLMNGGANGGITGHGMQPMNESYPSDQFDTIFSITDHEINNKHIGHYCTVSPSKDGDSLCIYLKYAQVLEQPTSIHYKIQLLDYGNKVSYISTLLGGEQSIITPTSCIFPLVIKGGLCYLPQQSPTDSEMYGLPQVLMISSKP